MEKLRACRGLPPPPAGPLVIGGVVRLRVPKLQRISEGVVNAVGCGQRGGVVRLRTHLYIYLGVNGLTLTLPVLLLLALPTEDTPI